MMVVALKAFSFSFTLALGYPLRPVVGALSPVALITDTFMRAFSFFAVLIGFALNFLISNLGDILAGI